MSPDLPQGRAYNKYLRNIKQSSQWIAQIDMDEFIYTKLRQNIRKILRGIPDDITRLDIQMKLFCLSSFLNPKSKIESQSHYMPDSAKHPKCISRTKGLKRIGIHGSKSEKTKARFFGHDSNIVCINHYRYQSVEYLYGIKRTERGWGP